MKFRDISHFDIISKELYKFIKDTLSRKTLTTYINDLQIDNDKIFYKGYNNELTFYIKNNKLLSEFNRPVIEIKTKVFDKVTSWYCYKVWFINNKIISYSSAYKVYDKESFDKLEDYSYNDEIPKYFETFEYKKLDECERPIYHRIISPSSVTYHNNNVSKIWYLNGDEYFYEDFCIMRNCLKAINKMKKIIRK